MSGHCCGGGKDPAPLGWPDKIFIGAGIGSISFWFIYSETPYRIVGVIGLCICAPLAIGMGIWAWKNGDK